MRLHSASIACLHSASIASNGFGTDRGRGTVSKRRYISRDTDKEDRTYEDVVVEYIL